jgi:hypothetical protein
MKTGSGSLLYVPGQPPRPQGNVGEGVGRMLVNQTPGGLHERFFEEVGERRRTDRDPSLRRRDVERVVEIAAEYASRYRLPVDRQTDRDATERRVRCRGQEKEPVMGAKNNALRTGARRVQAIKASTPTQWPSWWSTSPCSP